MLHPVHGVQLKTVMERDGFTTVEELPPSGGWRRFRLS